MPEVPVLDISQRDARPDALAQQFLDIYGTLGFGYITGHDIDPDLTTRIFDASARFHALPLDEKLALSLDENHRGFIPINSSTDVNSKLATVTKPNQSESFMVMREDPAGTDGYLSGPNKWPEIKGFREDVAAYHDALSRLGHDLMRIAALSIGVDPDRILPAFEPATTWLRLLYYPPAPPQRPDDLFGSAPHTDFGCLTILAQDGVGGLQVQHPDGTWIDAPAIKDSFVVNVGDMLHRWSNGILKSTPHRVINLSGKPRYSCPFFYDPHVRTDIAPLPETVTLDRPARFDQANFGDFLRAELEAGYKAHQTP